MGTPAGSGIAAADYLILGRVLTMDPSCPVAGAVAVAGNRIQAVGPLEDVVQLRGPRTCVIDTAGRLVLPAFHDAHLHLLKYARSQKNFDCGGIDSLAGLQLALRRWSHTLEPGAWLHADRYDDKHLLGGFPDRHDLDAAVSDRPVRVEHRGLHLAIFNTRAIEALGSSAGRLQGPGIEYDRDGQPTGRMFDGAYARYLQPRHAKRQIAEDVRAACRELLSWGITTVQDASVTNDACRWRLFQQLVENGALQVRLVM